MDVSISTLRQWLGERERIVVLSGAGMSTESGIPDFRSNSGVWNNPDLMEAMTFSYLKRHPEQFWPKFKDVFMRPEYLAAVPHAGYAALASIEQSGKRLDVFTQNVDGLHQRAGNRSIYELHGNVREATCPACGQRYDLAYLLTDDVPRCQWITMKGAECDTILHPNTVLFEQPVRHYEEAVLAVARCDLMLVLGTSLTVDPVASLPVYLSKERAKLAIINLDETEWDGRADIVIRKPVGTVLPQLVG